MLMETMRVLTLIIVGLAMIPAVAHALELPGKMRLAKEEYFVVQRIYYPGFTFAGISEPAGSIVTLVLLLLTPPGTMVFWLTLFALIGLLAMQAVYWIFVHPVNKAWVQGSSMSALGSGFFAFGRSGTSSSEWTDLRHRWEYAHLVRAALVGLSFIALVMAIS